jgi:phosphoribosylformimino-5-aminoimidazole carboxamide ribotide isomerase
MILLPVLDLAGGVAVHARRGQRDRYRPVESRLAPGSSDPLQLCRTLRSLGFTAVYIADLDAITGRGEHGSTIAGIRRETGLSILLDTGVRTAADCAALLDTGVEQVLVGSETVADLPELAAMVRLAGADRLMFSLDLRGGRVLAASPALAAMEPVALLGRARECGINRAVTIDLDAVGSEAGPNLALISAARCAVPGCALLAGGGVRGAADLRLLEAAGAAGCLIATCLHTGALRPDELRGYL